MKRETAMGEKTFLTSSDRRVGLRERKGKKTARRHPGRLEWREGTASIVEVAFCTAIITTIDGGERKRRRLNRFLFRREVGEATPPS